MRKIIPIRLFQLRGKGRRNALRIFSLIGMLIISASVLAEVYDDEGKIITEEEIEREMGLGKTYRSGCTTVGCLVNIPTFFGIIISIVEEGDEILSKTRTVIFGGGMIIVSYGAGFYLDRRAAIKRIKEKRRRQKQGFLNSENERFLLAHYELRMEPNRLHHRRGEIDITLPLLIVIF